MNATNFGTNKDFRKTVDIRQKMRHGKIERKIYLPPEEFAYGLPNRPPTPFKDVIYNAYGNRAEDVIRNEYDCYIRERSVKNMRPPKVVPRYINPKVEELKRKEMEKKAGSLNGYDPLDVPLDMLEQTKKNEKPLYFYNIENKSIIQMLARPLEKKNENENNVSIASKNQCLKSRALSGVTLSGENHENDENDNLEDTLTDQNKLLIKVKNK